MGALWKDESATTALEYALMIALIVMSVVAGYRSIGLIIADEAAAGTDGIGNAGAYRPAGPASALGAAGPMGAGAP